MSCKHDSDETLVINQQTMQYRFIHGYPHAEILVGSQYLMYMGIFMSEISDYYGPVYMCYKCSDILYVQEKEDVYKRLYIEQAQDLFGEMVLVTET